MPLATFAHNTFNSPNLANHSPYKLVFGRTLKLLLDLEMDPDIKVSGTYREYFAQLGKRLKYLHRPLLDSQLKRLALINKDRDDFQYNSGDLVYIISPLTSQLRTASRKVSIKYVGPLAVYKIVDPHNYLLITLDGKLLRGLFEHERLKPAVIRTNQGKCNQPIEIETSYVFWIISTIMGVMRKGPIISNYKESKQMTKWNWTEGPS